MLPKSLRVTLRLSESALAMPKSSTLIAPVAEIRTLPGLRSPWTSDRNCRPSIVVSNSCAASRNRQIWVAAATASVGPSGPRAITSERFSPSTYSIAMK